MTSGLLIPSELGSVRALVNIPDPTMRGLLGSFTTYSPYGNLPDNETCGFSASVSFHIRRRSRQRGFGLRRSRGRPVVSFVRVSAPWNRTGHYGRCTHGSARRHPFPRSRRFCPRFYFCERNFSSTRNSRLIRSNVRPVSLLIL